MFTLKEKTRQLAHGEFMPWQFATEHKFYHTCATKPRVTKMIIDSLRNTVISDKSIMTSDIHILEVLGFSDNPSTFQDDKNKKVMLLKNNIFITLQIPNY